MDDLKVRVLLEDINHKIETIWEVVADNPERFDRLEKKVDQLQEDMIIVKLALKNKADISEIQKINKKIKILQARIAN